MFERDRSVAAKMMINGLSIVNHYPHFDWLKLDVSNDHRALVIGGCRAFLIVVEDFTALSKAIEHKLVQEIASIGQCYAMLERFTAMLAAAIGVM